VADLKFSDAEPDDQERAVVDALVQQPPVIRQSERVVLGGIRRADQARHLLLPGLHGLNNARGWISPGGLNYLAESLQVPPAEAFGVASFYDLFELEEPGLPGPRHHVCVDASCALSNAAEYAQRLRSEGQNVHEGPCLGQCENAPALFVQARNSEALDVTATKKDEPKFNTQLANRLLRRFGVVDPGSLGSYRSHGGYQALETALAIGGEETLRLITDAGLTGRGGAAFPTGRKWQAVADQDHIHKYVVANADESEPGTFKDRMIIENDPFALIEAMTIAGVTTGCTKGWIYIRGEYVTATKRLQSAIKQAYESGFLGANALNGAFTFDIELRQGAGAYICGEETALFNSIEGFRGEPRSKPPFPTDQGLFGCPTIVNNPETLINVLEIVNYGVESFRSVGTADSPGTKLFCLSGDVAQPGLYEAAFGLPLNELLNTAGVLVGDVQAVLLGGAAGSFLGPQGLDLPLSFEGTAERGATLGSGAVTVFSRDVDLWPVLVRLAKFFRDESCGQCVPCRIGTTRQHEVLLQIQGTAPQESTRDLLSDLSLVMGDASICGLGHTAASAVQSAFALGLVEAET